MTDKPVKKPVPNHYVQAEFKEIIKAEGDKHEFEHAGFQCYMLRHPDLGHWCGYVIVGKDNPLYGKQYNEDLPFLREAADKRGLDPFSATDGIGILIACISGQLDPTLDVVVRVHGGITFSEPPYWIKSKDNLWAFGFDCAHYLDIQPYEKRYADVINTEAHYRNKSYAEYECRSMADQLRTITEAVEMEARHDD